ncbi:MAG TPA: sigma-70 family RNA polymerase sigma factor [Polyangiaceae bacterium]|nr:sigma-70 family RNA polymerase sigma factor [Polyangiaceae bacterium]
MLDETLRRVHAEACAAYPGVVLPVEVFAAHVRTLLSNDGNDGWLIHGHELYLTCACAHGDARAMDLFTRDVLPAATEAIARLNADADFVDDVLQALCCTLFVGPDPKIAHYSARGSLVGWTKVAATRHALNQLGSRARARSRHEALTERLTREHAIDGEAVLTKGRYLELFQQALNRAISELPARERNVLRMHLVGRCNIDQIGNIYSVHRATVARWLWVTRQTLFDSVRAQLRADQPDLTDEEFESVARLVRSQLDLSLKGSSASSADSA